MLKIIEDMLEENFSGKKRQNNLKEKEEVKLLVLLMLWYQTQEDKSSAGKWILYNSIYKINT